MKIINQKQWSLPDPIHVLSCIEKWRNLDLRRKSDSEIDFELKSFLNSLEKIVVSSTSKNFYSLWRVRKLDYLFKDTFECWEPPARFSKTGRCNAEGSSVLYVSKKLRTPFEELAIQPNQQVYLIKYKVNETLNLKKVISEKPVINDEQGTSLFIDEKSMLSYQILREFTRSEFLKPVGKGTEYLYKISSSICRVWFDEEDSDGWLYPSVHSLNDLNIAVKPKSARKKLKIEDVRIVRMINSYEIVRSGKIDNSYLPLIDSMKRIVQSDFKSIINNDQITWVPTKEIGGEF